MQLYTQLHNKVRKTQVRPIHNIRAKSYDTSFISQVTWHKLLFSLANSRTVHIMYSLPVTLATSPLISPTMKSTCIVSTIHGMNHHALLFSHSQSQSHCIYSKAISKPSVLFKTIQQPHSHMQCANNN